jgi:hypothetical protein
MEKVCQDCFVKINIGDSIIKRAFGWCCYPTCTYRQRDAFFTPTKTNSGQGSNSGKYSEEVLCSFDDHEFSEKKNCVKSMMRFTLQVKLKSNSMMTCLPLTNPM